MVAEAQSYRDIVPSCGHDNLHNSLRTIPWTQHPSHFEETRSGVNDVGNIRATVDAADTVCLWGQH